ncbi:putative retrotransposon ty1-copia subclass protein [Tanacetum coccineum]
MNDDYGDELKESDGEKDLEAHYTNVKPLSKALPRKEKDPGSFTLPCFFNNMCFNKALADLGASVSVMPYSTYTTIGLRDLFPTKLIVELADRIVKQPKGITENVLVGPEIDKWLEAMNTKMQSMKDNQVWVLVDLPPNGRTVGSKWLFKKKTDMDGNVHTFKARLVAKGYTQTYNVDYRETFSPIAYIRAIRILLAIAAFYDYDISQMDVKTTFLNGHLSEDVYMVQPEGFVDQKHSNKVTMPQKSSEDYKNTRHYIPKISHEFRTPIREKLMNLEERYIHEGRVVFDNFADLNYVRSLFHFVEFECLLEINEQIFPRFILEFYSQYQINYSNKGQMFVEFVIQNQLFSYSLENFAQILDIPCEGACVFTDRWRLDELAYGIPSDGPYQTNPR